MYPSPSPSRLGSRWLWLAGVFLRGGFFAPVTKIHAGKIKKKKRKTTWNQLSAQWKLASLVLRRKGWTIVYLPEILLWGQSKLSVN